MEQVIKVKSSSSNEIYHVVFKIDNNLISVNCDCKAGIVKTLCKHRLSLFDGDYTAISSQSDIILLNQIFDKIKKSKIDEVFTELKFIENEMKKLELQKKKLKKETWLRIANGF